MSYIRAERYMEENASVNESAATDQSTISSRTDVSAMGMQDMFGNDVKTKGKPMKGYRYLIFTVLMMICLSLVVTINAPDLKKIQEQKIA